MPQSNITAVLPYWEESDLTIVCGISNAGGGTIIVKNADRKNKKRKDLRHFRKVFETIPALCLHELGLTCTTEPVMDGMDLCFEINVPPAEEPIGYMGNYYLYSNGKSQKISGEEIECLYDKNANAVWESRLQPFVREDDLDPDIATMVSEAVSTELGEAAPSERAISGLLQKFAIKSTQRNSFTNIGVLLFHRRPEAFIPGAAVQIGLFRSNGAKAGMSEYIDGPLTKQLRDAIAVIYERFLPAAFELEDEEGASIAPSRGAHAANVAPDSMMPPQEALQEALLNALVHKNYESEAPVRVSVYPTMLYVGNVGRPPASWTLSDLLGRHNSRPHNPGLALALQRGGLFSGWGSGIGTMVAACTAADFPAPEFNLRADEMDVCFRFGDATDDGADEAAQETAETQQSAHAAGIAASEAVPARPAPGTTASAGTSEASQATGQASSGAAVARPATSYAYVSTEGSSGSPGQNNPDRKPTFKERSIAAANRLDMTSTDEYILKVVETNGRITAVRISEVLGVSESTVRRSFRRLREYGLIERIGSDKAGYWRIAD